MHVSVTEDTSTLVLVLAWCRQATSRYLNQCRPRSSTPYGVTRPQWVNAVAPGSVAVVLDVYFKLTIQSSSLFGDVTKYRIAEIFCIFHNHGNFFSPFTNWGLVTHICVNKVGLSRVRCEAITRSNADLLSSRPSKQTWVKLYSKHTSFLYLNGCQMCAKYWSFR